MAPYEPIPNPDDRRAVLEFCRTRLLDKLDESDDARSMPALTKELRAIAAELDALPTGTEVSTDDQLRARREDRKAHLRTVASGEG